MLRWQLYIKKYLWKALWFLFPSKQDRIGNQNEKNIICGEVITWPNSNFLFLKYGRNKQMSLFTLLKLASDKSTLSSKEVLYHAVLWCKFLLTADVYLAPALWSNATILDAGFLLGNWTLGLGLGTWKIYLLRTSFDHHFCGWRYVTCKRIQQTTCL